MTESESFVIMWLLEDPCTLRECAAFWEIVVNSLGDDDLAELQPREVYAELLERRAVQLREVGVHFDATARELRLRSESR